MGIHMIAKNVDASLTRVEPTNLFTQSATGRKQLPLIQILWQRRWTVLATVVLCLIGATVYLLKATPIYTSSSRIFVDQTGPRLLTADSDAGLVKSDSYLYTQAQVISSTPILTAAIANMDVHSMVTFKGVDNVLAFLEKELQVDVGKKDDLITVSMDSASPQEAAEIANNVVDAYMTFSSGMKRNSAAEVLRILTKERDVTGQELAQKLQEMLKFKRDNGALSLQDKDGNIIIERLAALQQSLTQCELDEADAEAEYELGAAMMSSPVAIRRYVDAQQSKGDQYRDQEYADLRSTLDKYELAEQQANLTAGPQSEQMKGIDLGIAALQKQVTERERRFAEAHLAELTDHLEAAKKKHMIIKQAFEAQQKLALDLNAKETEYAELQADLDRLQDSYKLLETRIKETDVSENGGALNIQVLEVGRPGEKPTKPRKTVTMSIALLAGLMLGTGAGLTLEWVDRKLRTPDEVVSALGVPVLGVVPHMRGRMTLVLRGQNVHRASMSETAEAYRTIRTAVQFGTGSAEEVKTLLVTSPSAGDGKSTSASNLAIAFAQAGYRTLLIDCDLRKPVQHKIFELEGEHGLTNVVAGEMKLAEAIRKTDTPRLSVLPCGPLPTNPSEMLNGKRFSKVMSALVAAFDKIIIDSPPVMPVTDARVLAASADVTILVVRADKTTDRQSALALDGLRSVGGVVLGVLMNDMPRRKEAYGYYSGYYYYGRESGGRRVVPAITADVSGDMDNDEVGVS